MRGLIMAAAAPIKCWRTLQARLLLGGFTATLVEAVMARLVFQPSRRTCGTPHGRLHATGLPAAS